MSIYLERAKTSAKTAVFLVCVSRIQHVSDSACGNPEITHRPGHDHDASQSDDKARGRRGDEINVNAPATGPAKPSHDVIHICPGVLPDR